jgi:hypothetical protein
MPRRTSLVIWLVTGAGLTALATVAYDVASLDQAREARGPAGGGIIIRSEVLRVWLPQTLIDLAKRQTKPSRIRNFEELHRILEDRNQQDVWYALTSRGHQESGEFIDLTVIRWPDRDSRNFPELLDVLDVASGHPPSEPGADFSNASIAVLPEDSLKREPRDVMRHALGTDLK